MLQGVQAKGNEIRGPLYPDGTKDRRILRFGLDLRRHQVPVIDQKYAAGDICLPRTRSKLRFLWEKFDA